MKIQQYTGPFQQNEELALKLDRGSSSSLYMHIGFQIPWREHFGAIHQKYEDTVPRREMHESRNPIQDLDSNLSKYYKDYFTSSDDYDFTIKSEDKIINSKKVKGFEQSFRVTDKCVLEFDNISDKNGKIIFHKNLPRETIIDIAYE